MFSLLAAINQVIEWSRNGAAQVPRNPCFSLIPSYPSLLRRNPTEDVDHLPEAVFVCLPYHTRRMARPDSLHFDPQFPFFAAAVRYHLSSPANHAATAGQSGCAGATVAATTEANSIVGD